MENKFLVEDLKGFDLSGVTKVTGPHKDTLVELDMGLGDDNELEELDRLLMNDKASGQSNPPIMTGRNIISKSMIGPKEYKRIQKKAKHIKSISKSSRKRNR